MMQPNNDLHQQIAELKRKNQQLQEQLDSFQKANEFIIKDDVFTFSDLINTTLIQELMNQFYKLTGYPIGIIDIEHNILVATGWQPICTDFYRVNKESCKLCYESDLFIQDHLQAGKFVEYKCKNGLWDIAQPILIDGKHMATIFLGQFFYEDEEINESFFIKQAKKYNFDQEVFIQSLKQVPRFSRKEITQLMTYYAQLAEILSLQGYLNLKNQKEINRTLKNKIELRRSKNKLHSIIEAIPSPIFVKDLNGKITLCNTSFAEKLNSSPDEVIGKTDFDIIPEKFALHNQKKDQELIDNPGKQIYPTKAILKDGTIHHVIFHKSSYTDENNKIAGIAGMAVEITEQIKIKKELEKAKEKAEHSDQLKSAFLANMSHEIRTPLNSIIGFADMLKNPKLTRLKQDKFLDIINTCGDQLLTLISDIIDISKIEANQISFEKDNIDLNNLIDSLYEVFKSKAKDMTIQFSRNKHSLHPEMRIKGDESKLRQILMNLLVNAFKFTHQGKISFGYKIKEDHYILFVKDTGIGIPTEYQQHVFDRFYQVENDNIEHSGTGLGLAISKGFVDFMGGQIEVSSELNKGTEFKITLPLIKSADAIEMEKPKVEISYNWDDLTILIAEDEETNYLYLEELLSPTGLDIIWAKNGKEAEEICKNNNDIKLILMDMKMPVSNGYQATRQIRKFRKDLPIIAQTAYAFSQDRKKAMEAGCSDYITKPILTKDLLDLIHQHLDA